MRILYISHLYPPEIAAAAARVSELSQRWARAGHQVVVLTGYPNHPTGRVPPEYARDYWWRVSRESDQGVAVVRAPLLPAANRGTLRRSCAFLSSTLSASLVAPLLPRADIMIATSPQPLNVLPGLLTQFARRIPFVFELRDLWPEQLVGVGYRGKSPMVQALRRLAACGYRRATHIVTVSPSYGPVLTSDYGVNPAKISMIPNGVDTAVFRPGTPPLRSLFGLREDQFVVGFIGTLGLSQRFEPVLAAAAQLRQSHPEIQFLIIGDGANRVRIEAAVRERGLHNVHIFGLQPRARMPGILAALDAALVLLDENPYFRLALPSKMFELMAMERPIVLLAEGVAADLLRHARAGVVVADTNDVVQAILRMQMQPAWAQSLGQDGRKFVLAQYDRDHLATRYLDLLQSLARCQALQRKAAGVSAA